MRDIIIDTDPGHDDALAIMLAVKSGMFRIHAITTVAGNSTIENTTRNARFILKLLKREDIPVYSGCEKPLKRELIQAVVHGKSGLEGLDPHNEPGLTGNAVQKILDIVESNPGKITLVTLGPLTNIATAINKNPEIMSMSKEIIMMGGAIHAPGNKNRVAEFNIFVDPEAADTVFRSPVKKTLIPLDACNHVKMFMEDFEKIKGPLRNPIIAMMKPFIRNIMEDEGVNAALMYDPLTIYYMMNPSACTRNEYNILVETKGDITRGMTVADLRKMTAEPNIMVIENISEERFKKDFIEIL
ncbi:MAG: nucleoside hydrolase [Candidatus Aenigmarchaeota archaeon]|nr:nucleoside hydrolase [Candidatus Aenigmarchaeota archaeon]MDI6722105.1 nucleoside hydrolase [Candidatus Aenigmarchaeota archaeon]